MFQGPRGTQKRSLMQECCTSAVLGPAFKYFGSQNSVLVYEHARTFVFECTSSKLEKADVSCKVIKGNATVVSYYVSHDPNTLEQKFKIEFKAEVDGPFSIAVCKNNQK
jgi:hypothetical protein